VTVDTVAVRGTEWMRPISPKYPRTDSRDGLPDAIRGTFSTSRSPEKTA
jgi:hypothetical protein